jgi:hypothetical protein
VCSDNDSGKSDSAQNEADDDSSDLPKLPDNGGVGGADGSLNWQECVDFLKYCRDEKCAYRNYTANCKNGGGCTCVGSAIIGGDATANFVCIERFAFAFLVVIIGVAFGTR